MRTTRKRQSCHGTSLGGTRAPAVHRLIGEEIEGMGGSGPDETGNHTSLALLISRAYILKVTCAVNGTARWVLPSVTERMTSLGAAEALICGLQTTERVQVA